jgi:hypothetical protein
VDARRLHPLDDTDHTAAVQVRELLEQLPSSGQPPLFVFDAGYDSAQLARDLADAPAAVLVRLRSDRCFYADPPPATRSPKGGRPRRHGAKFALAAPATWPAPTATLICKDEQYGTVTVQAWGGLHPKQQRHPGHGQPRAPPDRARHHHPHAGPARPRPDPPTEGAVAVVGGPGGLAAESGPGVAGVRTPVRPGAHRPLLQADPRLGHATAAPSRAGRTVDLAGPGGLCPAAPGPASRRRSAADVGAAPTPTSALAYRVRRGFPQLLVRLGSPASAPKPAGCPPGRPKGRCSGPARRYPAIKKPTRKPPKKQTRTAKAA